MFWSKAVPLLSSPLARATTLVLLVLAREVRPLHPSCAQPNATKPGQHTRGGQAAYIAELERRIFELESNEVAHAAAVEEQIQVTLLDCRGHIVFRAAESW